MNSLRSISPARVTILGCLPPLLGISAYCKALSLALSEQTQVEFISFRNMYPGFLYPGDKMEDDTVSPPVHSNLYIRRKLNWYNPLSWIMEGVRMTGEVLHVQWWSIPLLPIFFTIMVIARIRKIPVIITVHNVRPHEGSKLFYWASKLLFRYADAFIVHSEPNVEQLQQLYGISKNNIMMIPHGVLSASESESLPKNKAKRNLGLSDEHSVLLMFGAVREYKGFDVALQALEKVLHKHQDVVLLIAGVLWMDFTPYEEIIDQKNLGKHVRTVFKYVPDDEVALYFRSADIVLLPYHHFSSQSGVGLLALPYGLPMLVSDVGGLTNLVIDPDSVINVGDQDSLAGRIIEILDDPLLAERLGTESIRLAKRYDWTSIAQKTIYAYQKMIKDLSSN